MPFKTLLKRLLFTYPVAICITKLLARIHGLCYSYLGPFAAAAEGGLHPKHRLMNYHMFFVNHLCDGDTVLDIGCGNGALLKDIVLKTKAHAVGVEISEENVQTAKKRLADFPEVEIVNSDIREYNSKHKFDTVVLSNVLEHIDKRVEFLHFVVTHFNPKKLLLRVPMFEREWLVPYKKELGLEWRLDRTHETEYTESEFIDELSSAGLDVQTIKFQWGEMYAVVTPSDNL